MCTCVLVMYIRTWGGHICLFTHASCDVATATINCEYLVYKLRHGDSKQMQLAINRVMHAE